MLKISTLNLLNLDFKFLICTKVLKEYQLIKLFYLKKSLIN